MDYFGDSVKLDPPVCTFYEPLDKIQYSYHALLNRSPHRIAVKVKCSDNSRYRLQPILAILRSMYGMHIQVTRYPGPHIPQADKVSVQLTRVTNPADEDPLAVWNRTPSYKELVMEIRVSK